MSKKVGVYIIDVIFKILLLLGFAAVILCILASYISPETSPIIQYFGIVAPAIIPFNIVISLYWIIRLKPFTTLAIITLILTFFPTSKIYRLDIKHEVKENYEVIKVISYNVMHFNDSSHVLKSNEVLKQVSDLRPDIACFQEFSTTANNTIDDISNNLSNLKYKRVLYTQNFKNNTGIGIATYSKYPIIKYESVEFENSNNCAMWVDIKIKSDTIRVFNLHLQTTSMSNEERIMLSDKDALTSLVRKRDIDKIKLIREKFLTNSVLRATQADEINFLIESSPHKVIVCGDFNDSPNSYTYNTVRGDLNDSFIEAGEGYGYSFKDFFSLYRIDYILFADGLTAHKYRLGESKYSDHYPIIAELIID